LLLLPPSLLLLLLLLLLSTHRVTSRQTDTVSPADKPTPCHQSTKRLSVACASFNSLATFFRL
jgi:hypothetical protein